MGTNISWTNETWNPVTGCSKVSPGCAHCYAEALSLKRGWSSKPWTPENAAENVVLHPERLAKPLHWRDPRRVFVNSMSDLFHEQVPITYIARVFAVMASARQHTFQVLTKRPERMERELIDPSFLDLLEAQSSELSAQWGYCYLWDGEEWPLKNVWLGTSVENQHFAEERIPHLLQTPAAVRFLSCEPLLGPVDLFNFLTYPPARPGSNIEALHWIIAGGESGPGYRPMDLQWARDIRDQCVAAGVPFFFKQSAAFRNETGTTLDGVEWHQYPERETVTA